MAWSKQSKKRIRQNEKRRIRNRNINSNLKTELKKSIGLLTDPEATKEVQLVQTQALVTISRADKAAKKHVIHKNKAARIKSRITKALNKVQAANKAQTTTKSS